MFINELEKQFGKTNPIMINEILNKYSNYSKQYVYRLINNSIQKEELKLFDRGVYYIPEKTSLGLTSLYPEQVIEEKYIRKGTNICGIYSGLNILNKFGITDQVPNTLEIITNNEKTRKRKIIINNREFIIRKSKCLITNDNYSAYTILQLFNDINDMDIISKESEERINNYIREHNITLKQLFLLSSYFKSTTIKRLTRSFIFDGTI